ncbi:MAG: DUF1461 domain-containing protein [Candidatus Woesearchaeota archaeon]
MKKKTITNICFFVLVISFSVLLVTSSILNSVYDLSFYEKQFDSLEKVRAVNPFEKTLMVLCYFENDNEYIDQSSVVFLDEKFESGEIEHLKDVKLVFFVISFAYDVSLIVSIITLGLALFMIFFHGKKEKQGYFLRKFFLKSLGYSGILVILVFGILGLGAYFSYDFIFDKLHELLFRDGSWIFSENSLLIKLYPYQFFNNFFWKIIKDLFLRVGLLLVLWILMLFEFIMYVNRLAFQKTMEQKKKMTKQFQDE